MAPSRLELLQVSATDFATGQALQLHGNLLLRRDTATGDALLYTAAGAATSGLFLGAVALASSWSSSPSSEDAKEDDPLLACASGD